MPLLWLSLATLAGIILANAVPQPTVTWVVLAAAFLVLTVARTILKRNRSDRFTLPIPIPVLLLSLTLSAAWYQSRLPDLNDPGFIATHNDLDRQMMVTGVIEAMPDVRDDCTYLRVKVEYMHPAGELEFSDVHGLVLVSTSPTKEFNYGDRVVIRGYLETPPVGEAFSYRDYLARQGIYTYMRNARVSRLETDQGRWFMTPISQLKTQALALVYRLWPDPEASLFSGILLGVETGIPEPVQEAFQATGTSHIIAISGFNFAIIASLFVRSFGRILGPFKGGFVALVTIAVYTVLVGASPAVVRAAIMGGLSIFVGLVGRRQMGVNALALTTIGMAIWNPQILWDVGFQLSCAATLGLVLYAEPLQEAFVQVTSRWWDEARVRRLAGPVGEFFLFTFAAQLTTLPIIAYHFGTLSWVAFLANPVILPVQPPIMILGGIALLLGLVWFPLGKIMALVAWPFMLFTIRAVEFFGRYTRGSLTLGEFSLLWVVLFYAILLTLTYRWDQIKPWLGGQFNRLQIVGFPLITLLGILAVVVWRAALTGPDGNLHLTVLNVGTGDAILITTPDGRYILVNGGPSTSLLSDGLGRRLPPFNRQLDWLVVASPRSEEITSLPRLIDRFPPAQVLWAGLHSPNRDADYLRETLTAHQIAVTDAEAGHALDLGRGARLEVLTAGNRGAILLLSWDRFRAVLPLGVSDGDFEALRVGADIGRVPVLLLADNGYAPTNPPAWIDNLNPQMVLLSAAPDDRDGLPSPDTLAVLEGYTLLRTDRNGWIELTTDGKQMWVEGERVERRREKYYASSTHPTNSDSGFYSPRSSSQSE